MEYRSINIYFRQCNMQDIRTLFSQASVIHYAYNLIEITPAVVIGLNIRRD